MYIDTPYLKTLRRYVDPYKIWLMAVRSHTLCERIAADGVEVIMLLPNLFRYPAYRSSETGA